MKKLLYVVGLGVMVSLMFSCGKSSQSPRIVCDLDGKMVPTTFTFAEFKKTLAAEHGQVVATGYEQLKTRSLVVDFSLLENGTVLAESARLIKSDRLISPAVLFGLTNNVREIIQTGPYEEWGANGPVTAPGTN